MTSPSDKKDQKPSPDSGLGSIAKGDRDGKLDNAKQPAVPKKVQKAETPKLEKMDLPKGALVALRKSGGLKFSTQSLVVYPDGRVSYGGGDTGKHLFERVARKMNDGQIAGLRKTLDQCNFFKLILGGGKQPPDSYAYEIIARSGNKTNFVEVFDGGIPDSLKPLIQQLDALFPKA